MQFKRLKKKHLKLKLSFQVKELQRMLKVMKINLNY